MVWYLSSWDFRLMFSSSSSLIRTSSASTFVPTLPILKAEYLKYMFSYHMVRICLAGCSDPDRQTGSDTSRYFGKSTFFFFSESRRGPVTPPASQQSATQKFSGPECLKSVISVTLDISGVAAQCPPTYWAKCRAEMRQIYQGGTSRRRRRGGRHIWEQLMLAAQCSEVTIGKRGLSSAII